MLSHKSKSDFIVWRELEKSESAGKYSHVILIMTKAPKDESEDKTKQKYKNIWYGKAMKDPYVARLEVVSQELFRLLVPSTPKTRLVIDKKGPTYVASKQIPGYHPLPAENAAVEDKIAFNNDIKNGTITGLGEVATIALLLNEIDLKNGNLALNDKNQIVKLDGDWCLARLISGWNWSPYELCLMSDKTPLQENKLYISENKKKLAYTAITPKGETVHDIPLPINIIKPLNTFTPDELDELQDNIQDMVLDRAFKAGHINENCTITENEIRSLPHPGNTKPYNWLGSIHSGACIRIPFLDIDLSTDKHIRAEINHALLKALVLPKDIIYKFINTYVSDLEVDKIYNEVDRRIDQLKEAALQNNSFKEYLQSDTAKQQLNEYVQYLLSFKTTDENLLIIDDNAATPNTQTPEIQTQFTDTIQTQFEMLRSTSLSIAVTDSTLDEYSKKISGIVISEKNNQTLPPLEKKQHERETRDVIINKPIQGSASQKQSDTTPGTTILPPITQKR